MPERKVWSRLRRARKHGAAFRRQHTLGPYVVDFYCPSAGLVVELDGRSHEGRTEDDAARQGYLEGLGLRVMRFLNDDVMKDPDGVVAAIVRAAGLEP